MAKKGGRWAGKLDKYPVHLGTNGPYQDKVTAEKDRIRREKPEVVADVDSISRAYITMRAYVEDQEAKLYVAGVRLVAITQMMHDMFKAKGMTSKTIAGESKDDDYTIVTFEEPYANVKDSAACLAWFKASGYKNKVTESVPWASTNAVVKELLEAGLPEPDGVEIFTKREVRLTRPKSKLPVETSSPLIEVVGNG